ncbi:MAG: MerR family transcriptional regulator [Candidatus Nanopelagicales bacterium]
MTAAEARPLLGIGEVLQQLRGEFPDVTISKIRFLESEGLVRPARTASGYRKFSPGDVDRLRYVLTLQRDHYLPLKVIRDNLDAVDRGLEPPLGGGEARAPSSLVTDGAPRTEEFRPTRTRVRLTRAELVASSGLDEHTLGQVESYGLIAPHAGGYYDADAVTVATAVARMTGFGIEPRHLRAFKVAADREVGLVEQVVSPIARQRGPEARVRAEEAVRELAALSVQLHTALVRAGLNRDDPSS